MIQRVQRERIGDIPDWTELAKKHLVIESDEDDELVEFLLSAAFDNVETYCNVSLVESEIKMYIQSANEGDTSELLYSPVTEILEHEGCEISHLDSGQPIFRMNGSDGYIRYKAGFNPIPDGYKLAVIKLVTDNFEQRAGFSMSGRLTLMEYPNNWKKSVASLRRRTFIT